MSRTLLRTSPPTERREQGRSRPGCLAALAAALLLAPAAFAHGSIALRSSVRVPGPQDLRLADIAVLTGPEAVSLADTVVVRATAGARSVDLDDVRTALKDADADWSRLTLSGSTCTITKPVPATPGAAADTTRQAPALVHAGIASDTVRALIPARIARVLGVQPEELRLSFSDADAEILDFSTKGRVVEISPSGAADRIPLQVEVYEAVDGRGFTLLKGGSVRVGVQVLREVAVAKAPLSRGRTIGAEDVTFERRWVAPSDRYSPKGEVLGSLVKSSIRPGQPIGAGDLDAPFLVKKGQVVSVRCVTSSVVLKSTARALEDGRLGQTIKLQPLDVREKKDTRSFTARVEGPGRTTTCPPGTEAGASENIPSAANADTAERPLVRIVKNGSQRRDR